MKCMFVLKSETVACFGSIFNAKNDTCYHVIDSEVIFKCRDFQFCSPTSCSRHLSTIMFDMYGESALNTSTSNAKVMNGIVLKLQPNIFSYVMIFDCLYISNNPWQNEIVFCGNDSAQQFIHLQSIISLPVMKKNNKCNDHFLYLTALHMIFDIFQCEKKEKMSVNYNLNINLKEIHHILKEMIEYGLEIHEKPDMIANYVQQCFKVLMGNITEVKIDFKVFFDKFSELKKYFMDGKCDGRNIGWIYFENILKIFPNLINLTLIANADILWNEEQFEQFLSFLDSMYESNLMCIEFIFENGNNFLQQTNVESMTIFVKDILCSKYMTRLSSVSWITNVDENDKIQFLKKIEIRKSLSKSSLKEIDISASVVEDASDEKSDSSEVIYDYGDSGGYGGYY